ncbi:MAG: YafY family transcriptional regulator [Boseongicola sp.]
MQVLRAASQPVSAEALADTLEVSQRTIYRDMSALQSMRIPIEGEAGVGYMMRRGYDLPPLNFDREEIEALRVGPRMLTRTGDSALTRAAARVCEKIDALHDEESWLQVAPWGAPFDDPEKGCVSKADLREAIRTAKKLRLTYRNEDDEETERIVRPLAMVYHVDCVMLAGWCELRGGFRHFRSDRIWSCEILEAEFSDQAAALRSLWLEQEGIGARYAEVGPAAG